MSNMIPTKNARTKRFVVSDFEGKIDTNLSSVFSSSLGVRNVTSNQIKVVNAVLINICTLNSSK